MMKEILIIYASPHENGFTKQLLNSIINEIPKNVHITQFNLFDFQVQPCTDCGHCKRDFSCVYDDLNSVFLALEAADFVLFATPVYNMSFPAPLKAMLDRTQKYYNARFALGIKPPIAKPKKAALAITSGTYDKNAYSFMLESLRRTCTVLNASLSARIVFSNTDTNAALPDKMAVKSFVLKMML